MFEDKDYIKNLVNQRDDDKIVIPLYVQIYGKKYSLLELKNVKVRFTESAFKVGYGTADALFMPNSFPVKRILDFDVITVFTEYDDKMDRTIRYMVFESGDLELPDAEEKDKLSEEIHGYFDMLYNHTKNVVDEYFKALIAEDTVPIIPKDEPKKEESVVEEDPLDELRKEIAEYSQDDEESPFEEDPEEIDEEEASEVTFEFEDDSDDDTETVSGIIVETDRTGTEIRKATSVEFISQGETNDDYLSEGIEFGNGQVDVLGNETNDEDYSTDFDVF